jgi:NNP family nitrate/nitrite transporter-like MFS transporter
MAEERINLFNLKSERIRTLHITWFAFFISFYIWFNMAPLMDSIRTVMDLTDQQVKVLMILNVAMTIPSRIAVGMLVDKFGPRIMFSFLLFISGILCIIFSMMDTFERLAMMRFLLAFVGAGFVIGIRMIGEWFPHKQVGIAEGIYGGWGNFGSAGAALTIPTVAILVTSIGGVGGENSWRYAIAISGMVAIAYSFFYYTFARDTPSGSTYFKPNKTGAMEVTSPGDFVLYLIMNIPLYLALALLTWKLSPVNLELLTSFWSNVIYGILVAVYLFQTYFVYQVNKDIFTKPVPEIHRYKFKQVAMLNLGYFCTFGSELAVVSMLPLFYFDMFKDTGMTQVMAGLVAASYAFVNLIARPGGGWMSDTFGRKKALIILLGGLALGYFLMNLIDSSWSIILAVVVTMFCSFFVMAGEGAVFAIVPLIKRRMTGQVAGMTGAYGNVGAVMFLTVFTFVEPQTFFLVIGGSALVVMVIIALFLDEPKGQMAEVLPDGTVQMIDVG